MDLGCLDLDCIEKQISQSSVDSDINPSDSLPSTSKPPKKKIMKEANQPSPRPLNRLTSQIKKPPRRKTSPLSWFARKKVDSYLKRKLKLLQEVDGMKSTLDETLHDTNPHFSKVLKEKIAVKEAAHKAIEARKAALVEASWCRILHAARIESREAETLLEKAEKAADEAFESAKEIGVIMYDIPDFPRKHYKIEKSDENSTHTFTTSFHTAFEVDKQVAASVKSAFIKLSTSSSIGKQEFKEILKKISQNPDLDETHHQDLCESVASLDIESESEPHKNEVNVLTDKEKQGEDLVDMMLERLRCLQEEELSSLATIVATCGLNAALQEGKMVNNKKLPQVHEELPGLDKFLVKRMTRLEKEVQDARNARAKEIKEKEDIKDKNFKECEVVSVDLGSMLTKHKHTSKLEKEIEEAKRKNGNEYEPKVKKSERLKQEMKDNNNIPGLGDVLVKRVSRLEREVREAKEKENVDGNKDRGKVGGVKVEVEQSGGGLDEILVKPKLRHEREKVEEDEKEVKNPLVAKREARERELEEAWGGMSFGNSVRPRLSKLQRDKEAWIKAEEEKKRANEEPRVV